MSYLAPAILLLIALTICTLDNLVFKQKQTNHSGFYSPEYGSVFEYFKEALQTESQGLSLAVIHKGEVKVNLYGGYADIESDRLYTNETLTIAFSCTKLLGSLAFAALLSEQGISYETKVSKYWPEFSSHGKDKLTISDVLDHKAGLVTFDDDEFTFEKSQNHTYISELIIKAKPKWEPKKFAGYHAITYGFLLDEMFWRIDPKQRTIAEYVKEKIISKFKKLNFYLGLPKKECHRVARVSNPTTSESIKSYVKHPYIFTNLMYLHFKFGGLAVKSASYPKFMSVLGEVIPYNNCELLGLPSVSALGVGTAVDFAKVIRQFFNEDIIQPKIWDQISVPLSYETDIVLGRTRHIGHGMFYLQKKRAPAEYSIAFTGNGHQFIDVDKKHDLIIVLLRNGLKAGLDNTESHRLRSIVYKVVNALE